MSGTRNGFGHCVLTSLLMLMATAAWGQGVSPVLSSSSSATNVSAPPVPKVPTETVPNAPASLPLYRISPGDTLDVTVFGAPDLSQKARVSSKGDVYLPLVNYVQVGGLDVQGAQDKIESALKNGNYMVSPHVTVVVSEYASGVVLMGEVAKPGIYPVTATNGRLLEILTEAGGTTPSAGEKVTITRHDSGQQQVVYLSHDPSKAIEANVPVFQGDTVMVSKAGTIFVVGEVLQPSAFLMESKSGYTALKALAMAHGPTRLANLSQAKIVRQTPTGVEQISVPLNKIADSKVPDTVLQAEDILVVPTNHSKVVAGQAASMAQSILMWGAIRAW